MNLTFGIKLRELRKEKGLKQDELAQIFNVSKTSICQYETFKQEPNLTLLVKIANYFNVTTDYLLGLENEYGSKVTEYEFEYQHNNTKLIHKEKK